jgi:hypothetical protein
MRVFSLRIDALLRVLRRHHVNANLAAKKRLQPVMRRTEMASRAQRRLAVTSIEK